ncbi:hypothetical protein HPG69_018588 [Diceros bicornis minor]|uniref:Uncharacterized protein n=1 Tax=Diceros bicornis minor TaxID=77932 RepID=A0A7J7EZW6_DICBM|nr:hypothetical protein HPG69_018588 [Diceros bicornis minor]
MLQQEGRRLTVTTRSQLRLETRPGASLAACRALSHTLYPVDKQFEKELPGLSTQEVKVHQRVYKGIFPQMQDQVWSLLLDTEKLKAENEGKYEGSESGLSGPWGSALLLGSFSVRVMEPELQTGLQPRAALPSQGPELEDGQNKRAGEARKVKIVNQPHLTCPAVGLRKVSSSRGRAALPASRSPLRWAGALGTASPGHKLRAQVGAVVLDRALRRGGEERLGWPGRCLERVGVWSSEEPTD